MATRYAVHDTLFVAQQQYDSIYIDRYYAVDRATDTIRTVDHQVEYRYRLLRDTTYIHRVDTVPQIIYVEKPQKRSSSALQFIRVLGLLSIVLLVLTLYLRTKN